MDYKKIYEAWLVNPYFDEETKAAVSYTHLTLPTTSRV